MKFHNLIIKKIPSLIKRELSLNLKIIPDSLLNKSFKFASALGDKGIERARDFINSNEPVKQYFSQISIFNEKEQSSLLSRKIEIYSKYSHYFQNSKPVVSNCQRLDIKEPLVEDLLMKVDKNTMAFSIEGRAPFLDYRVVELSSKIPDYLKLKILNRDKFILRKIVKGLIPEKTRKRKKKHFFVPIDNWFKNELIGLKEELLSENYISKQKIFNHDYIKNINSGFEKSKLYYSRQLWALIVFQIWYKLFIEESKIKI